MTDTWRYRCPRGHTSIVKRIGDSTRGGAKPKAKWYCKTCKELGKERHYDHIIDTKTGKVCTGP